MRGGAFNFVDVRIWEQRKSSNAPEANFDENDALRDGRLKRGVVLQISSQVTKPLSWCGAEKNKSRTLGDGLTVARWKQRAALTMMQALVSTCGTNAEGIEQTLANNGR
jgi:hypothetical protein